MDVVVVIFVLLAVAWLMMMAGDGLASKHTGCQFIAVRMGQMRPRKDHGASREGEGLLLEMEWVPW